MKTNTITHIKVADETWIATALLHRENPERNEFTVSEIVARAEKESIFGRLRPGIRVHATLHCVANLPPNPGRYRMLFATGKGVRRLFRERDPYDRSREGGKQVPERDEIPQEYRHLLDWYFSEYSILDGPASASENSILCLCGVGKELWRGEDPDGYVRGLREGWS